MIIRKLWSNKWMFLCLLLGAIMAVGMVTSIPMYTDGVLTRMLRRDLQNHQEKTGTYPGRFSYELNIATYPLEKRINNLQYFDREIDRRKIIEPLPLLSQTNSLSLSWLTARRIDADVKDLGGSIKIVTQDQIFDHVTFLSGKRPSSTVVDGVYEIAMSQKLMHQSPYLLDQVYSVADTRSKTALEGVDQYKYTMKFKIVGVFEIAESKDLYWFDKGHLVEDNLVMDDTLLKQDFVFIDTPFLQIATWNLAYDYQSIKIDTLALVTSALEANLVWLRTYHAGPATMSALELMQTYNNREQTLRTMLTIMQVPIMIMLAFYIFMVTQLILESEKGEISVLKSRGASRTQIMGIYLVESLLVAGIALACGPPLGVAICSILGASNGFLEFVTRRSLPIEISANAIQFALVAAAFIVLTMLIPAFFASKVGIVEQRMAKNHTKIAFWKKTGIDFILLGLAGYGWYSYQLRQTALALSGATAIEVPVDPLLFLLSTAFIVGAGLLFLRFYPLFVRIVYAMGRKKWSPALYASFVQVGRSGGQEQFLMLFLIITLSLGIFSANSARTINLNVEEKIHYRIGADLVMTPIWRSNEKAAPSSDAPNPAAQSGIASTNPTESGAKGYGNATFITYIEPPFEPYATLDGIKKASKVLVKQEVTVLQPGKTSLRGHVMAIEPNTFGEVAFMPDGLLKPHWYDYLNLLANDKNGALVSRAFAEKADLTLGDTFQATWSEQNPITFRVSAIIDYWPTYNAMKMQDAYMMVCNLSLVQATMAVEPYQIWYSRELGVTSASIYQQIEERALQTASLVDTNQMLIQAKNDPMLQGTNGALTMAFIVTMTVSFFGFIIYWVLSIKSRVLQFGILRAMGMSMRSIIGMLLWEQLLISGIAVLVGVLLGGITAQIFTPLLQMVYDAVDQVPPFRVVASREDYMKIYAIITAMLTIGFAILGLLISRIRIAQALKLGEE